MTEIIIETKWDLIKALTRLREKVENKATNEKISEQLDEIIQCLEAAKEIKVKR